MKTSPFRVASLAGLVFLAGCFSPPEAAVLRGSVSLIGDEDPATRERAFRVLSRGGAAVLPQLKQALPAGAKYGLPAVALLYVLGEGDAVPMDLKARHLAAFRWPVAPEHALLEPYAWNEIERDLARAGTPALPLLARALSRHAVSEAKALQVVRLMLRIGGREAARAFAGLLGVERDLRGVRVCDIAAAALLFEGRQEMALRLVDRKERLKQAREWWEEAKGLSEEMWVIGSRAALAERWTEEDREGIRPVFELLAGEAVKDPKAWVRAHPKGNSVEIMDPRELVKRLSGPRPEAYAANRRLEERAGARLYVPRMDSLGELCAALRLWRAPPHLGLRWRRHFEGPLLRLSIAVVGHHPDRGRNHVLFVREEFFHASEDDTGELTLGTRKRSYFLYVQAREQGTRLVYSEYASTEEGNRGRTREVSAALPLAELSSLLEGCVVVAVEEVSRRLRPRPQEVFFAETRARLRDLVDRTEGRDRQRALRALGYLQNPADRQLFRENRAGEALLLQGDPAGLEFDPALRPYEIEMALRQAKDGPLRTALERMKKETEP